MAITPDSIATVAVVELADTVAIIRLVHSRPA